MSRKRINIEKKKVNFGITIHPELSKILNIQAKKENKSKSKLIEEIMIEYFKKEININD